MGTEVVHVPTGEIVTLEDAEDQFLADYLKWLRGQEASAREVKRLLTEEFHRRMDRDANWTLRAGAFKVTGTAPGGKDYDPDALRANLEPFVQVERISEDALLAAVEPVTVNKARKRGITALLKLGDDEITKAIELSEQPAGARRISLSEES